MFVKPASLGVFFFVSLLHRCKRGSSQIRAPQESVKTVPSEQTKPEYKLDFNLAYLFWLSIAKIGGTMYSD